MKEKVQSALDNYVLAYMNNDKDLFRSLWDEEAIFEDPVGADPCNGIDAYSTEPTLASINKLVLALKSLRHPIKLLNLLSKKPGCHP